MAVSDFSAVPDLKLSGRDSGEAAMPLAPRARALTTDESADR